MRVIILHDTLNQQFFWFDTLRGQNFPSACGSVRTQEIKSWVCYRLRIIRTNEYEVFVSQVRHCCFRLKSGYHFLFANFLVISQKRIRGTHHALLFRNAFRNMHFLANPHSFSFQSAYRYLCFTRTIFHLRFHIIDPHTYLRGTLWMANAPPRARVRFIWMCFMDNVCCIKTKDRADELSVYHMLTSFFFIHEAFCLFLHG